ncbi:MAG: recombination mediator RecR [Acidimicrobiales bacterium]
MYTGPLRSLIDELGRMPGIGPKSAQRIAFYLLKAPLEDVTRLSNAIVVMKERTTLCSICFNISEGGGLCDVCDDAHRDGSILCIVEDPRDIVAVERTHRFKGRYHVLHGALNPLEGVGPDQLKIAELMERVGNEPIAEVILCTNPNLEGEATAMYLAKLLSRTDVSVTRIASGLPVGGDLEYADELTLGRALDGRTDLTTVRDGSTTI